MRKGLSDQALAFIEGLVTGLLIAAMYVIVAAVDQWVVPA